MIPENKKSEVRSQNSEAAAALRAEVSLSPAF
jgi:hypothetical protein